MNFYDSNVCKVHIGGNKIKSCNLPFVNVLRMPLLSLQSKDVLLIVLQPHPNAASFVFANRNNN